MVTERRLAGLPVPLWARLLLLGCCWGLPPGRHAAAPTADFCTSCHVSATCLQENGKSVCICNYGFIGNGRTYCNDKDECQIGAYNICGNHSACHNTHGSFYCTCQEGFQPSNNNSNNTYIPNDGTYCKDIDECRITGLCGYGATCKNTNGSYECYCMKGYRIENGTQPFRTDGGNITGSCTDVDCGFPLVVPNALIDSENKTTFGSTVTYSCRKGFVSDGGGGSTSTCTADGTWGRVALVCTEIDCGRPPTVENSDITEDDTTVFGSRARYRCIEGFYGTHGTNTSICTEHGVWETPTLSCKAVDCGDPPLFPNALARLHSNTSYGSGVVYECQYGYALESGNTTAGCNAKGQWEGAEPVCRAVDCGNPPLFPNSVARLPSNTTYGSGVVYECQYGYALESGNTTAVCNARGQWKGAEPVCRAVDCGNPPLFPNSVAHLPSNTTYGSVVVYECQYGYALESGNTTAVCNSRGQWKGAGPVCRAVDCGDPPAFPNASAGPHTNTTYGSAVVYECHNGYIVESGNQTAVCTGRGKWKDADLVCRVVDCGAPPSFLNVSPGLQSSTTYGSVVVYECQDGYSVESGNHTAICNDSGQWEGADPVCREIDCGVPPLIPHAEMIWNSTTKIGSVAHYQCLHGFHMVGKGNRSVCTARRSWENVTFSCHAMDCGRPPLIPHTKLIWDNSTGAGSVVLYTCQNGFRRTNGTNVTHCMANGSWEVPDIICKEIDCGVPKRIENADLVWSGNSSMGSKLNYVCKMGFTRSGGRNYSLCTDEGVWEKSTFTCTVEKADIISNLSLFNETCVMWRKAIGRRNWKIHYSVHIRGERWYQVEFSHIMAFNFTDDSESLKVCLRLRPGTNYTVNLTAAAPDGSVLQRTFIILTTVKKFNINVTALNETCLQWRGADAERIYQLHVRGSRWYQKDFWHEMSFDLSTDAESPVLCLDLRPGTNYTVNITAASSRSSVDFFMTTPIADPPLPELKYIEVQGPAPKFSLRRAEEINGPISSYQILVLLSDAQSTFSCNSLMRSSFFSNVSSTEGYVAAEILSKDFDDHLEFSLGDRQYYGDFYNAPLKRGKDYYIVLRITSEWNKERAQSCMKWAHIKDKAAVHQHMTMVGLGSLAIVCFFIFISFSAAWCCKRR